MKRALSLCLVFALTLILGVGSVLADDRDQTRGRKRDGTCKKITTLNDDSFTTAADRTRDRDRKRDGSCRS